MMEKNVNFAAPSFSAETNHKSWSRQHLKTTGEDGYILKLVNCRTQQNVDDPFYYLHPEPQKRYKFICTVSRIYILLTSTQFSSLLLSSKERIDKNEGERGEREIQ